MSSRLKREILRRCHSMGIPLLGIAPAERWDKPLFEPWVPEAFRPRSIWPEAESVIVIGLPVHLPVLETAPSIWYHELYTTINRLLDSGGYLLASYLNSRGFPSVAIPRDGYGSIAVLLENPVAFFSHRHAALLAGLGNFGLNNMLLTPGFGPRVRFASVFSAAELPPNPVLEEQLCTHCMACIKACPVNALVSDGYPEGLTDKHACSTRSAELYRRHISPCGLCIRACPVGKDRELYDRTSPGIYNEKDRNYDRLHRAWDHVRRYGGR